MADWANYLTIDVLGDLCFGKPFGLIESDEFRAAPDLMLARTRLLAVIAASPFSSAFNLLASLLPLDRLLNSQAVRDVVTFRLFATLAIKERLNELDSPTKLSRQDFLYYLTRALGTVYTEADFMQELHLLMVAGSDTISITISACFYYLTRYPAVLARLQVELRETFTSVDDIITGPTLSSCKYLRAIINETLRIAPPAGVPLQREVIGNGLVVDGRFLPAGTLLGTAIYALHHSPEYFSDPEVFKPERWLPEHTSADEISRGKAAFAPFSIGARGCVGKTMAYNELSLALARVFYMYDTRLEPGDKTGEREEDGLYDLKDVFIAERRGPRVQFREHKF